MERDKNLEQLIKENGLVSAPVNFTGKVMDRIHSEPVKMKYKPLVGRGGKIFMLITLLSVIVITILYSEPTGFLAEREINLPKWNLSLQNFSLQDLSFQNLPELNITTGMLTALLAVFILVVSDALLNKRKEYL